MVNILYNKHKISSIFNPRKLWHNFRWRYGAKISELPHIFVVGCPRSGTTLMYSILASHPNLIGMDVETFFFVPRDALNIHNYDRIVEACEISEEKMTHLFNKSQDLVDFYDKLAHFFCQDQSSQRLLEKTPFHALSLGYLTKHFPNGKFINMIRDGRDCYVSHQRVEQRYYPVEKLAKLWKDSIRSRCQIIDDEKILDVRYEELVNFPCDIIQRVMNFLGENFYESQINQNSYANVQMFAHLDPQRKSSGHERLNKPISATSVGQWKEKMTTEEINKFQSIAAQELKLYSYT